MLLVVSGGLLAATPYQGDGFAVQLPGEWDLAPRFGDLDGMGFSRVLPRRHGGGTAHVRVQVTPAEREFGGQTAETGAPRPRTVGGRRVIFRVEKTAQAVVERARFRWAAQQVRIELRYPARDEDFFRSDLAALLESFRLAQDGTEGDPIPFEPLPERLVGTWQGRRDLRLTLTEDGRFRLADLEGVVRFERGRLHLQGDGGEPQVFRVRWLGPGRFALLQDGVRAEYRRVEEPRAGTWVGSGVRLQLAQDGTFRVGDRAGRWSLEGQKLTLVPDTGLPITYQLEKHPDRWILTGADLDRPLILRRN